MGAYVELPPNWVPVLEEPVFTPRKLRVVCIGAGYSGLMLAYKYKHEHHMDEYIDLSIYEKNTDIGGTWFENRYPGVACDVLFFSRSIAPSYSQYTFTHTSNLDM